VGEHPAVLRWAIDGCLAWQRDGLMLPSSVVEVTEAYFSDQDIIGQWIEESRLALPGVAAILERVGEPVRRPRLQAVLVAPVEPALEPAPTDRAGAA
jgi:hypothetical protein